MDIDNSYCQIPVAPLPPFLDGPGPSIPTDQPRLATGGLFRWVKIPFDTIFSVGDSFIMTGIAHSFHVLAPGRLQFHFSFFHLGRCAQSSNCYGHAAARMGISEFCGS
jgi:hypothetical protein